MKNHWLLEYLDFMSVEAKLYIKGKDRYVTKLGSLMTILSFISVIVISSFFIKYWIEKVDVNVLFSKEVSDEEFYIDLNFKPFFFRLVDVNNKAVDPRLVTFTLLNNYISDKKILLNNTQLESCTSEKHFPDPKYKNLLENIDYENYFCINNDKHNSSIILNEKKNINNYYGLYIHECNNSTSNNNSCYSREKIKEYLATSNFFIRGFFPDFTIDHFNSTNPIQEKLTLLFRRIYTDIFYKNVNLFKQVKYTSDEGLVMHDSKTWISFGKDEASYAEISPKAVMPVPNTISSTIFRMEEGKVDSYKRSYQKLQNVLANIGGILKTITTISTFFVQYFTSQMLDLDLSNNFVYDEEKLQIKHTNFVEKSSITDADGLKPNVPILNINFPNKNKIHHKLNIPVIKTRTERRRLTCLETLIPKQCSKASSVKKNIDNYSSIIKFYMSTNNFLKLFKDFENLKYLYLNQKECEIFEYMRCDSLKEHLEKIEKMNKKNENNLNSIDYDKYINNLLKSIEDKDSPTSDNRILQKMMERI